MAASSPWMRSAACSTMARWPSTASGSSPAAAPAPWRGASQPPPGLEPAPKAVLPGLIDAHAHAGHAMLKTMGGGNGEAWMHACKTIYTSASDENFWEVESH